MLPVHIPSAAAAQDASHLIMKLHAEAPAKKNTTPFKAKLTVFCTAAAGRENGGAALSSWAGHASAARAGPNLDGAHTCGISGWQLCHTGS